MKIKKSPGRKYSGSDLDKTLFLKNIKLRSRAKVSLDCNRKTAELYQYSVENCDICNETFNNKYTLFIHNTQHIIIPLRKQKYYECPECFFYYASLYYLNKHISDKHLIKEELFIKEETQLVKEEMTQKESQINENNKMKHEKIQINGNIETQITEIDDITNEEPVVTKPFIDNVQSIRGSESEGSIEPIRSRLQFESDLDLDEDLITLNSKSLLDNLTVDCKVNLEMFDDKWLFPKLIEQNKNKNHQSNHARVEFVSYKDSVHYDDLIEPCMHECRLCYKISSNRYNAVVHETEHLRMKKCYYCLCPVCESFFSSTWDLRYHKRDKHPNIDMFPQSTKKCDRCGLKYYNYQKHHNKYHLVHLCRYCSRRFETEAENLAHMSLHSQITSCTKCNVELTEYEVPKHICKLETQFNKSVLKICNICAIFYKNKGKKTYRKISEKSEIGVLQMCDRCKTKVFTVKLIERTMRSDPVSRGNMQGIYNRRKPLSKIDRLKIIQKRFNHMNK